MRAIECAAIADVYADDIDHIEVLGENVRIVFFTWQDGERIVVAKIVRPRATFNVMFAERVKMAQAEFEARQQDRKLVVALN